LCGRERLKVIIYPPAVIIHGLGDARAALAVSRKVTLLSAAGAGLYAGCLWWQTLIAAAEADAPAFLDCADAPGRAMEALRLGVRGVILGCGPDLFSAVGGIAREKNAALLAAAPPALDLAAPGARRKLGAWLNA
jgi:hypothetical protein